MSANVPCKCGLPYGPAAPKEVRENWRVRQRGCNHSAFNGRRYTPSDYSEVTCLRCNGSWRTKASYVVELQDYFA